MERNKNATKHNPINGIRFFLVYLFDTSTSGFLFQKRCHMLKTKSIQKLETKKKTKIAKKNRTAVKFISDFSSEVFFHFKSTFAARRLFGRI